MKILILKVTENLIINFNVIGGMKNYKLSPIFLTVTLNETKSTHDKKDI